MIYCATPTFSLSLSCCLSFLCWPRISAHSYFCNLFFFLSFVTGKYGHYSALDGTDMNYGSEDNGMGLTMGLGGMAGLGNYGTTLIEVNRILSSVPTASVL